MEIISGLGQICSLEESHCVCTVQVLEAPCLMQAVLGAGLPWSAFLCLAAMTFQLLPVQCYVSTEQQLGDFQGAMDSCSPSLVCGQLAGSSSFLGAGCVQVPLWAEGEEASVKHFYASCRELLLGSLNSLHPTAAGFHGVEEDCASPQRAGAGSAQCKGWLVDWETALEQRGLFFPVWQKGSLKQT